MLRSSTRRLAAASMLCLVAVSSAFAADNDKTANGVETVVTVLESDPAKGEQGYEYRAVAAAAFQEVNQSHDIGAARAILAPALTGCDKARGKSGRQALSFSSREEYDSYVSGAGVKVFWLDMGCAKAYKAAAFIDVEAGEFDKALAHLQTAHELAPYWPEPLAERGYILNTHRDSDGALASYREALAMTEAHPAAAYAKALVLRGMGYAMVELKDWKGARDAYEQSLKLDPASDLARRELDFIDSQDGSAKPTTTTK